MKQTSTERTKPSAKKAAAASEVPLKLRWELHDLPSSQHRAGLAGLVLCVRFLARRPARKGVCEVENVDANGATLVADREGMRSLFDEIYAATIEETRSKSKWPGTEPKRIDEVETADKQTGKVQKTKFFVYDRVVPAGLMPAEWDQSTGPTKFWLKLWQDFIWTTLRGVPATREPYNARAENRPSDDGADAWDDLATKPDASVDLPSTYALGAQARSAENVPFKDVSRFRFLLHFWPFVAALYVPATLSRDLKREFVGHAVAIPDVAMLDDFVDSWDALARSRDPAPSGYVPKEAVIDLPAEAGLHLILRANQLIASKEGAARTAHWMSGIDVFHLEKEGNNVRTRGVGRVTPSERQDREYAMVRRSDYWSPVFRRQRLVNVLKGVPWWNDFARVCSTTPQEMTCRHNSFRHDCRLAFTEVEMKEDVSEEELTLEHLIYRRVQAYLLGKVDRKFDLNWSKVKGTAQESDYRDKKEKVGREAFLAVRSRTGADFVAYFTSTICSVPHRSSERRYLELARALTNPEEIERVRSLTLLALSALS